MTIPSAYLIEDSTPGGLSGDINRSCGLVVFQLDWAVYFGWCLPMSPVGDDGTRWSLQSWGDE